jgi:hypothetical protein
LGDGELVAADGDLTDGTKALLRVDDLLGDGGNMEARRPMPGEI